MQGYIFTTLLGMIDTDFGPDKRAEICAAAGLADDFDNQQHYPETQLFDLAHAASQQTGQSLAEIWRLTGRALFYYFLKHYPSYFLGACTSFDCLSRLALYAERHQDWSDHSSIFVKFTVTALGRNKLEIDYHPTHPLRDLAYGLLQGLGLYYKERLKISYNPIDDRYVKFLLQNMPNPIKSAKLNLK